MKKKTPVEYLKEKWYSDENVTDRTFEQALQMEAQKQQKYNEMLEMIKNFMVYMPKNNIDDANMYYEALQLTKEDTKL